MLRDEGLATVTVKRRQGIKRQDPAWSSHPQPLNTRHEAILSLLGTRKPTRPPDIAAALQLPSSGITASLYALQGRGLVERVPYEGWIRKA